MRAFAAIWGVLGITAMLVEAEVRLARLALDALWPHPAALPAALAAVWCLLNAWLEGYRGFQKRFVPLALDRAFSIDTRSRLDVALAPLNVLGVWRTELKVRRRALIMVVGISTLVYAVKHLPQPWRGVIDSGVVVGLIWGTAALLFGLVSRLTARRAAAPR